MKVKLIGAINYKKLAEYFNRIKDEISKDRQELLDMIEGFFPRVLDEEKVNQLCEKLDRYLLELTDQDRNTIKDQIRNAFCGTDKSSSKVLFERLRKLVDEQTSRLSDKLDGAIEEVRELEKEGRLNKVAAGGRLSRFPGTVSEILEMTEEKSYGANLNFSEMVFGLGHTSITEHDYCVFSIEDVSPVVEQTIIEERFSSFTIKSRREVDFSHVGFYIPEFRGKNFTPMEVQDIQNEYIEHEQFLFGCYEQLLRRGIKKEDARFVLPYSYHSNIIMGVDAHTLKDMIIRFKKSPLSKIQELREFGERLYEIAKENLEYIIPEIDAAPVREEDTVRSKFDKIVKKPDYKVLPVPNLVRCTSNVDETILISAIMRRYQFSYEESKKVLEIIENGGRKAKGLKKQDIMRELAFNGDEEELAQVNFQFQIPLSLAVLTHLTRHRTHHLMTPGFVPNIDLSQYRVPPAIEEDPESLAILEDAFEQNQRVYKRFREEYGICEEDLVYFALSGNIVNVLTNMDGKTLRHVSQLRECNKAQWEINEALHIMHAFVGNKLDAQVYASILGPTCETQGFCKEGKESCGKINTLKPKKDK